MKLYLLIGYYCHRSYLFEKYKYWSNLMGYKTDFVRPEGEGSKGGTIAYWKQLHMHKPNPSPLLCSLQVKHLSN